jgi:hypothetical protein
MLCYDQLYPETYASATDRPQLEAAARRVRTVLETCIDFGAIILRLLRKGKAREMLDHRRGASAGSQHQEGQMATQCATLVMGLTTIQKCVILGTELAEVA